MASLVESTAELVSNLRLSAIPKNWTDQIWDEEFCEAYGLPVCLDEDAGDCNYHTKILREVLDVCRVWFRNGPSIDASNSSSTEPNRGFWSSLSDINASPRAFVAVLHAFIELSKKDSPIGAKKEASVLAADIYINLIGIPGSGAYKVYHPHLLQKAVEVVHFWPEKESNKRKRKSGQSSQQAQSSQRGKTRRTNRTHQSRAADDDEDDWMESSSDELEDENMNVLNKEEMQQRIKRLIVDFIKDCISVLKSFTLRDSEHVLHHIIQLFTELTRLEAEKLQPIFSIEGDNLQKAVSVAQLAYMGLAVLCSSTHGDVASIIRVIFKHLIANLLMSYCSTGSISTIPKGMRLIRDQAVQFVSWLAGKEDTEILSGIRVLIQHMCMKVTDKSEFRVTVAKAIIDFLKLLPASIYADLLQWIHKLSKNSKIGYRVFALDIVFQLLDEPQREADENTLEESLCFLTHSFLVGVILARCSDKAPTVRGKALSYVGMCAESTNDAVVTVIKEILENAPESAWKNEATDVSFDDRKLMLMLRRRAADDKVVVRKAALQALESFLRLKLHNLQKLELETVHDRCKDPALSVRKQAMLSITGLLQQVPTNTVLQSVWLNAVMPLVMDRESTLQEKCLETVEEIIIHNVVDFPRSTESRHNLAWSLLKIIGSPQGQQIKRYFQKACTLWSKQGKFTSNFLKALTSHVNTVNNQGAWLLLSEIANYSSKLDHEFFTAYWREYTNQESDQDDSTLTSILTVLGSLAQHLPIDVVESITNDLQRGLSKFDAPVQLIAVYINTLCKLCNTQPTAKARINSWCADLLIASETFLSNVVLNPDSVVNVDEQVIIRHLFTVGEVAQLIPTKTTEKLFLLVQSMIISPKAQETINKDPLPSTPAPIEKHALTPTVQAHAIVTLGKLCLQNEPLAKLCVPALSRELEVSDDPAVRNNIAMVLCDLCVRYATVIDRYIPNISTLLRDPVPMVRKQTLTLLTHLFQEDFVKMKGSLFFHFITTLVDEEEEIRKLADFCLIHLLLQRHPGMFYQHFVETIFHFNSFNKHKVYNQFVQSDREKTLFSLKGQQNTSKRMKIYQFLLFHMPDDQRFNLTGKICQEVLGGIIDGAIVLDADSAPVLRDALSILTCKDIKLASMKVKQVEDLADEGDAAGAAIVTARNKVITQVLKKNTIESIVPNIIGMKHILEAKRSPLLKELMCCLKDIMKDYKTEVQDLLAADKQLANEIEFDLRMFEEEEKALQQQQELQAQQRQQRRSSVGGASPQANSPGHGASTAQGPQTTSGPGSNLVTPQVNSNLVTPGTITLVQSSPDKGSSSLRLPHTPPVIKSPRRRSMPANGRNTLAARAMLNSAMKAVEHASRVTEERRKSLGSPVAPPMHEDPPARSNTRAASAGMQTPQSSERRGRSLRSNQKKNPAVDMDSSFKTPVKTARAASTPEGDISHISRVSFVDKCIVPLSPIPCQLPIRVYPQSKKDSKPSWIAKELRDIEDDDGVKRTKDVICLPSPDKPLPKPRIWNVRSPKSSSKSSEDGTTARRTRSYRRTKC